MQTRNGLAKSPHLALPVLPVVLSIVVATVALSELEKTLLPNNRIAVSV